MTHTGKIARLPRPVRDELNRRLLDGETGPCLAQWLNQQPDARAALAEHHGGRAITVQNLSAWRQRGLADWCQQQDVLQIAQQLGETADDCGALADSKRLADRLAQATAIALMAQLRAAGAMPEGPRKLRATLAVVDGLVRLRHSDRQREREVREHEWHEREIAAADRIQANPSKSNQIQPAACSAPGEPTRPASPVMSAGQGLGPRSPVVSAPPLLRESPSLPASAAAEALADRSAGVAQSDQIRPNPSKSNPSSRGAGTRRYERHGQIQPPARIAPVEPIVALPPPSPTSATTATAVAGAAIAPQPAAPSTVLPVTAPYPVAFNSTLFRESPSRPVSSLAAALADAAACTAKSEQIRPNPSKSNLIVRPAAPVPPANARGYHPGKTSRGLDMISPPPLFPHAPPFSSAIAPFLRHRSPSVSVSIRVHPWFKPPPISPLYLRALTAWHRSP